jgi:hypothetical protein
MGMAQILGYSRRHQSTVNRRFTVGVLAHSWTQPLSSRGADASESLAASSPSKNRGCREGRVPTAPMVRVQQKARGRTTGTSRTSGLPCANGLRLIRDLPGNRLFCPRRQRCASISTATWSQHRETRTTRLRRPRPCRSSVGSATSIAFQPNVRDDRDTPSMCGSEQRGNIKKAWSAVK